MERQPIDEEAIFKVASKIELIDARSAYLKQVCGDDEPLRERVITLLRVHDEEASFLESPAAAFAATLAPAPNTEKPGDSIGPYRLREQIGEGGFGVVYVAEQETPVSRKVALKIIKPGMDTKDVIARFEAERQALALMDHPHVARVLDAGTTDSGRPFFVMELVRGVPITDFCDERKLSNRERLSLFVDVCRAVQHAHQKGIIHRDLKPSNVMVTLSDGKPVAKVIDFGVSKALSRKLTDKTVYTAYGQMIGTPMYMSPEQAELTTNDVDTRSDVYSLGVLLYELLTGATPFDRETLQRSGFDEMRRIIREVEPPRPSVRVSTLHLDALATASRQREIDSRKLSQSLSGELDWIVMKALEKDRNRRYESASGFAADVQRFLNDEPVQACSPSVWYRFRKFARRKKVTLTASALVALAVLLGTGVSVWEAVRATRERDRAILAEELAESRLELEQQERRRAERAERRGAVEAENSRREAAVSKAVNEFLNTILSQTDPNDERSRDVTLRDVVEHAAREVEGRFKEGPLVEASVRQTIGTTFASLGEYNLAATHLTLALNQRRQILGSEHPDTLESMCDLASLYLDQENYSAAEPLLVEARDTALRVHAPALFRASNALGILYMQFGKHAVAETFLREGLEASRRILGPEHVETIRSMANLAVLHRNHGDYDAAEELMAKVVEFNRRELGEDHPTTLRSVANLGLLRQEQGRIDSAAALLREALEGQRRVMGVAHPDTLTTMDKLGTLYRLQNNLSEAETLLTEALELTRRSHGADDQNTATSMNNLAQVYYVQGSYIRAEELFAGALEVLRNVCGTRHPETIIVMLNLGVVYIELDRLDAAEALFIEALDARRDVLGDDHPATCKLLSSLSILYLRQGRHAEAKPLISELLDIICQTQPSNTSLISGILDHLVDCLFEESQFVDAERIARKCLAIVQEHTPDDPVRYIPISLLGESLARQGRLAEAERPLLDGYRGMKAHAMAIPAAQVAEALERLIALYETWGRPDEVARWRSEAEDMGETKPSAYESPETPTKQ